MRGGSEHKIAPLCVFGVLVCFCVFFTETLTEAFTETSTEDRQKHRSRTEAFTEALTETQWFWASNACIEASEAIS